MEKAKCKSAIEAAEKAQKIAEMETQRRKFAELKVQREAAERKRALTVLTSNDVHCRKYTIEEIEVATNNFSSSNKIGEGGYGPVFKGTLDHTPVAIKALRSDAKQGRKQFQQEVCFFGTKFYFFHDLIVLQTMHYTSKLTKLMTDLMFLHAKLHIDKYFSGDINCWE